jgi:hypothetical protein
MESAKDIPLNPGRTCLHCIHKNEAFKIQAGGFIFSGCNLGYYPKSDWLMLWRLSIYFGGKRMDYSEKGMHFCFAADCLDYERR